MTQLKNQKKIIYRNKSKTKKTKKTKKSKNKTRQIAGSKKHRGSKKPHKESVDPETYAQYLRLGKTEEPHLIKTEFSIQEHPDIQRISKTLLSDIIQSSTYSLLPYYFSPNSPVEKHDDYLSESNSGNCVFFAKKVQKELQKHGIRGYLIPATTLSYLMQPGFPELCHCVVLVRTPVYFIIYEPAFYILEPIFVPIDGTPVQYMIDVYEKNWTYQYDAPNNRINVLDNNGEPNLYYSLLEVQNPSTAISYPVNIHNQRIPIVKYDCNKKAKDAHLSIRLDTKCLEGYCSTQKNTVDMNGLEDDNGWFPRFDYKPILDSPGSEEEKKEQIGSWIGLSENQCISLQCKRDELINKIFAVIMHDHSDI